MSSFRRFAGRRGITAAIAAAAMAGAGLVAAVPFAAASTTPAVVVGNGAEASLDHFVGTFLTNAQGYPEEFWVDNGQVAHTYWDGTAWSPAAPLGGPSVGAVSRQVGAELNSLGNAELYVIGSDGVVYHSYSTPGRGTGWSGWDPMGGPAWVSIVGQIGVGRNYVGNQELYVLGSDGVVYHDFATPGRGSGWSGWDPMDRPAAGIAGDVHAGRNQFDNQELFAVGVDGVVYHDFSTPGAGTGWSGWGPLGTPPAGLAGDVAVWRDWQKHEELFVVGADHQLWHDTATPGVGSGWSGWSALGAPGGAAMTGFVGLYQASLDGRLTVVTQASDGAYSSISASNGTGSPTWSGWSPGSPAPVPLPAPPVDQTLCASTTGHGAVIVRQTQLSYLCDGHSLVRTMPFTANNTQPGPALYHVYARVSTTTSSEGQCGRGCVLHNFLPFTRGRQGARIGFHLDPILSGTGQYVEPPDQIGTEATRGDSSGCFRLRPDDSAAAWAFLSIGSPVLVI